MVVAVAAVVAAAVVVVLVVAAVLGTPAYKLARAKVQPGPSHYLPRKKCLAGCTVRALPQWSPT